MTTVHNSTTSQQICANCSTSCITTIEKDDDDPAVSPPQSIKKRKLSSSAAIHEIVLNSIPTTTIKVQNALTEIYNLKVTHELDLDGLVEGVKSSASSHAVTEEENDVVLCGVCGETLQNLYVMYDDFNNLRKQDSYLSNKIGQLDLIISRLKETWGQISIINSNTRLDEGKDEISNNPLVETELVQENSEVNNFIGDDHGGDVDDNYLEMKLEVPDDFQFEGEEDEDYSNNTLDDDPATMTIYPDLGLIVNEEEEENQDNNWEDCVIVGDTSSSDDDDEDDCQIGTTMSSKALPALGHSGVLRSFKCLEPNCSSTFITKRQLDLHSLTHDGSSRAAAASKIITPSNQPQSSHHTQASSSQLKCLAPECPKIFWSQRQLKNHVYDCQYLKKEETPKRIQHFQATANRKTTMNTCPMCPIEKLKMFRLVDHLIDHWMTDHKCSDLMQCPVCRFKSVNQKGMDIHLRTHVSTTPVAKGRVQSVKKPAIKESVVSKYGAKTFKICPLCPKSTQSYSHPMIELCNHWMIEHHVDGDNSCPLCTSTFSSFESLRYHLKAHVGDRRVTSTLDL